jgi:hypothetical protein
MHGCLPSDQPSPPGERNLLPLRRHARKNISDTQSGQPSIKSLTAQVFDFAQIQAKNRSFFRGIALEF